MQSYYSLIANVVMEKFLYYLFKEEIKHDPKTSPIVMTDKIG